jgi:hypothetical protein
VNVGRQEEKVLLSMSDLDEALTNTDQSDEGNLRRRPARWLRVPPAQGTEVEAAAAVAVGHGCNERVQELDANRSALLAQVG